MKPEWLATVNGQEYGPYSWDQMLQMAAEGRVPADLPVKRLRDSEWYKASQIPGLLPRPATTNSAAVSALPPPAPAAAPGEQKQTPTPPPVARKDDSQLKRARHLSSGGSTAASPPPVPTPPPPPPPPKTTAPAAHEPVAPATGFPVIVTDAETIARPAASKDAAATLPCARRSPLVIGGMIATGLAAVLVVVMAILLVWKLGSVNSEIATAPAGVLQPPVTQTGSPARKPGADATEEADEEAATDRPTKAELAAQAQKVASISNWQSIAGLKSFGVSNASLQISRVWRMSADETSAGDGATDTGMAGKLFCVEIAIHNKSRGPLKYRGWNSYGANGAILADERGQVLPLVPPAKTSQIERMTGSTVPGGATVTEVLVFEAPASEAEVLHLVLPYGVFYSNVRPPYRAIELTPDMVGMDLAVATAPTAESPPNAAVSRDADATADAAKDTTAAKVVAKGKAKQPPSIKELVDNDPGFPMPPAESSDNKADEKGKDAKSTDKPNSDKKKPEDPLAPKP